MNPRDWMVSTHLLEMEASEMDTAISGRVFILLRRTPRHSTSSPGVRVQHAPPMLLLLCRSEIHTRQQSALQNRPDVVS